MLSDDTHVQYVQVTSEHLEGLNNVVFDLNVPSLEKEKYIMGNRIYIEYRLENVRNSSMYFMKKPESPLPPINMTKNETATNRTKTKRKPYRFIPLRPLIPRVLAREMFDVMDLPPFPARGDDDTIYWVVAGISLAVILAIVSFVFYKWRQGRIPKPKEKRL
jgi:hypothetical protein